MTIINKHKTGLAIGAFFGFFHLTWVALVALEIAQTLIDWIFRLHFIRPPYAIEPFSIGLTLALIGVTTLIGYSLGWSLAAIWNWVRPDKTL